MPATHRTLLFTLLAVFLSHASLIHSQTALQFVPVTPCRVVDTRHAPGPFGGPPIGAGGERDFAIPQSTCSIPYAAAYSLNVTVVPHGGLGYLTVWPTGQTRPVISTLNSLDGRIKANAAIVPSGTNGAVSVYATNTTDVVLDIDGYFVPATTSTLAFFPLTPCRVADTRRSQGPLGGPKLTGGVQRDFPVLSSSCNIPDSAQGYSLNFTAVPTGGLGYLTVWPTGQAKPQVSTLNDLTGTIVANAAIVPAGESGAVSVFASNDTNLVIDIDGYFAPSSSGPENALSLYTLAPCRLLDTRKTMHAFSGTIPVGVLQSGCQVPSAQAYVLNATVVPQNGKPLSYLTLWPDAEGKPLVSTLNALDGAITSNMAIVPTLNGSIDAYATDPTDLVLDIFSYFAPIAPLGITTAALPSATLTYNYSTAVAATGGVAPYVWSIAAGSLPPGLSLNPSTGAISGMPTMSGPYPFTVQVTDSQSPAATASAPLSIAVSSSLGQPTIITAALPPGKQNQTYNAVLAASGGATPYTWRITAGSLPAGLGLISSTGAITGTPTGGGTANFTVQVADSEMPPATASTAFSVTISAAVPLSVTSTLLPSGVVGRIYSGSLTAVGGTYPYTVGNYLRRLTGWVDPEPEHRRYYRDALSCRKLELYCAGYGCGDATGECLGNGWHHHQSQRWRQFSSSHRALRVLLERFRLQRRMDACRQLHLRWQRQYCQRRLGRQFGNWAAIHFRHYRQLLHRGKRFEYSYLTRSILRSGDVCVRSFLFRQRQNH